MKYNIKMMCGHEQEIELFGPGKEREKKIWYYENKCLCRNCYEAEKKSSCEEIEMSYKEYKEKYQKNMTKKGSYNPDTKTIIVYVEKR